MHFLLLLFFIPLCLFAGKRIELVHDFTVDPSSQSLFEEGEGSPWYQLKRTLAEKDICLVSSMLEGFKDSADLAHVVFWNVPTYAKKALGALPKNKAILFMWEPPTVHQAQYKEKLQAHFAKIYTWDDSLVDNRKFFKFYYPVLRPMQKELPRFEEKKLCTLIVTNKKSKHPLELYSERKKVVRFFEGKEGFDFYGRGWEAKEYKNYRGAIGNKIEVLKQYRFSFCYENMQKVKGYITEKIFDCFEAGSVPIYLGADNIEEYIPANCFIDRRKFASEQAVYDFIKNMSKSDYEAYLANINNYLKSEKAQLFSAKHFVATFVDAIH